MIMVGSCSSELLISQQFSSGSTDPLIDPLDPLTDPLIYPLADSLTAPLTGEAATIKTIESASTAAHKCACFQ